MLAEVQKINIEDPQPQAIQYAASMISRGQVVGIPTDTYYGLAADPFNLAAVEQVYRLKGRPEQKALPVLVGSTDQAAALARDVPDAFLKLAHKFWPGALTMVVFATERIPLKVTGNTGRIAIRWPASKVACSLIEAAGIPVTGTSANLSGMPACSNAIQLVKQIGNRVPLILDGGETGATLASTIVDLRGEEWRILREGTISEEAVRKVLD
ncbi:MAG: threonylcarbamoyl-AMP synthase [Acidobacteria bacterium]|nr:threonylcarbamoyl-AMP synthase [Acidobacteriota bacterium]